MSIQFSVIVPLYKVEEYARKCIESILAQEFYDFELILVDDGSPDDCPKICDEYALKDSRVRVIHKSNGGLVSARNAGLREAAGEYICYVDGDDWVEKNLLSTIYNKAILKYHPDMIIYGATRCYEDRKASIPQGPEEGFYKKKPAEKRCVSIYDVRCKAAFL